jgi:tripartite-type tricarboxylate transporter receptor subunit TctC
MKIRCRQFLGIVTLTVTGILLASSQTAWSQGTRTIKIVVPNPPGGGADILARLLAEQIGRARAVSMVVENRPGAGSVIATEGVSRAAPDGKTVLIAGNSFVINPHLRKVSYDPRGSFEPICYLVSLPLVIAVSSASPYRSLSELLDAARAKPGDLTMASFGPATAQHISFEMLKRAANVNMIYVPYPGNAPAISALLGGHLTAVLSDYPTVAEQLRAGTLRGLATTSGTRIELLSEIPTVAESGYTDYESDGWFEVVAPANTPKETVSELADWFGAAVRAPELKPKLVIQGLYPVGSCGPDAAAHIRKQYDLYGRIIREANIKAE